MEIRRFKDGDASALFDVFSSSIRDLASRDYTPQQIEVWASKDIDPQQWASHMKALNPFVVEVKGRIAGYADVQSNGYIDHFYVSGAYAKQGVGSLLMKGLHEEAERLGLNELTSNVSKTAESFFERQGFTVVKRNLPVRQGVTLQNALMRKGLVN
ncbi:GNAT family N-acetyltransferase [Pantoea rodasii]|uniref:GNAT family N-acetyltransferase n=1 Tax=Pantoea rodasii TaxID=1076549 RepID=A0A2M9W5V6_9GAMM|nr:GNAT family N-acetyltransferase [Pantoea rodasii]ORM65356.1 GNAT family N-acetyltransferase [Pantoea rodasii]PJZ02922.1 GNAT family N-acetyltransferase [Pantoea rodasii]